MLQLLNETDVIDKKTVNVLIYGYPGTGKTSIANTAESVLLLDFDEGIERAINNKQTVAKIDEWKDMLDLMESKEIENRGIKTIVMDTVGTCLDDYLADYVMKKEPKNEKKGGGLSLAGYGAMKDEFKKFYDTMRSKGIDLVFIAHLTERMEGDEAVLRPKITGGTYDILNAKCDQIGWIYMKNDKRILSFQPTDSAVGKDAGEIGNLTIPDYKNGDLYDNFMKENVIGAIKEKMNERNQKAVEYSEFVKNEKALISNLKNTADVNTKLGEVLANKDMPNGVLTQVKYTLFNKAKALGLKYDDGKSKFAKASKKPEDKDKES